MFCKYCGKEVKDGSMFCPYCGKKLQNGESQERNPQKNLTTEVSIDQKTQKKNKPTKPELPPQKRKINQYKKDSTHKSHKICIVSTIAFFVIFITCFILAVKKEKTYYSGQYQPTNTQSQYEVGQRSVNNKTQTKNTSSYIGYLATVDDLVKLKKFIDSHCGEQIDLELYYPENLSLKFVDLSSEPVEYKNFSLRDNMNTSVSNVFSAWGKNSFIYVASSLLYSERSQYDHKYERYNGHLNFWLHGTNIKPNMFILNIKSNYGQITWETSNDIDDDIRELNFKLCQDDPNFEKMHIKGTFTVESPVNSNDFNKHAGYPTYPEEWQNLDYDYVYFSPDGEPTDMVVYNLIPE